MPLFAKRSSVATGLVWIVFKKLMNQGLLLCIQCGLDKLRKNIDFTAQEEIFRAQLKLAKELERPVSVGGSWCVLSYSITFAQSTETLWLLFMWCSSCMILIESCYLLAVLWYFFVFMLSPKDTTNWPLFWGAWEFPFDPKHIGLPYLIDLPLSALPELWGEYFNA